MDEDDISPDLMARLDDDMVQRIARIIRSDAPVRLVLGNLHRAAGLRKILAETLQKIISLC